jgi:superfamily II DNA/RNA helicase
VPRESKTSTDTLAGTDAGTETLAVTDFDTTPRFEDLGLGPEILRAVTDSGYTTPTPIQAQGIPEVLKGRDLIGIAQTGTGKTASFTLPMIEQLGRGRAKARMSRSLILEPTRELAAQVAESFERYGKYHKLSMALLIGGVSFEEQNRKLDRGVDVLIATPGRLLDHFERGKLMLNGVQIFVIDEADRMLDMGFIPDVERIASLTPFTRQTLFYSATMPPEIQRLTDQFLQGPVRIEVTRPATAASTIKQIMVTVPGGDWSKRETLRRLLRENDVKNAIVFCNRKRDVDVVAKSLTKHGFSAAPLHGDLDQPVRTKTLGAFKTGDVQFLVASDVAARGLDIPAVSHIFNFDVPMHADDYVHRIGRTGRAGLTGIAFTLVGRSDEKNVTAIESLIGQNVERRVMEDLPPEQERRSPPRRGHERRTRGRGKRPEHNRRHETAKREPTGGTSKEKVAPVENETPVKTTASAKVATKNSPSAKPKLEQPKPRVNSRSDVQGSGQRSVIPEDQLPAFLLRPVILPLKSTKKKQDRDAETDPVS